MSTTALGVAADSNGNGLDALTYRRLTRQLWHNTGVIGWLTVSGLSSLYYQVAAGAAVCSMADSDGYTQAYWPGGTTENPVSAGDATYPRIDVVYMLANTGTPDNRVHVAVASGTPASSPVKPSLPTGALEIMSMLMPAGATSTSSATAADDSMTFAIPYGAQLGLLNQVHNTASNALSEDSKWHNQASLKVTVPTDRLVDIQWRCAASVPSTGSSDVDVNSNFGDYLLRLTIDGDTMESNRILVTRFDTVAELNFHYTLTKGTRT